MIPAQDHKRVWEGDLGPNTGGMGSYSCEDHSLPFLTSEHIHQASAINRAVAAALYEEVGRPYKGVLYGGFMLTADGVRLLEYNARFADPEAMNVLPLLETNFVEVCAAIIASRLSRLAITFRQKATVCKYVVPKGYPVNPVRGSVIDLETIPDPSDHFRMYFAAVDERDGQVFLTGSRAVAMVGIGDSVIEAERIAESAASRVAGTVEHRKDIGTLKLLQQRVDHMKRLRPTTAAD
jgi:phosphoribosylamine--glycine ligase